MIFSRSLPVPERPFFIGLDSDGSIFDTMEIKHKLVFQPIAIRLWDLEPVADSFNTISETIHLYSAHRGTNRFQGLALICERLVARSAYARKALDGHEALREFINSGDQLSSAALDAYNRIRRSDFLDKVLDWSRTCDAHYATIMESRGNAPYPNVRPCLARASLRATIMVISSSSHETLIKDWRDAGLLSLTSGVAGQEMGSKAVQLKNLLPERHDRSRALMVGDALGDLEAAQASGILFYPIIAGAERSSWHLFQSEALDRFFQGHYAGDYERALIATFQEALQPDVDWTPERSERTEAPATQTVL
jgi:phosphoglycolate phosphatase-like HAD superfamily hydrolase